ncbi:MAG: tetratricopeptide repeat protein [Alphaproteobacteria bacterium]|nr:tetratricopeptide repeat protein [Alphaproteobacteria bacterium]
MQARARKNWAMAGLLFVLLANAGCDSQDDREAKYLQRGNALFEQKDYARARIEYKNAARIKPSDAQVRYRLGLVDEAEGELRNAFAQFMAAEQQDAHYVPALKRLVHYLIAGGDLGEANKRIQTLLKEAPDDTEVYALHAALLFRSKDYETAEQVAKKALDRDAHCLVAYSVLTGLYLAQNDLDAAKTIIEKGTASNPDSTPLLILQAVVLEKRGEMDQAVATYQRLFTLTPDDIVVRDGLVKLFLKAGRLDDAQAVWQDAIDHSPDNRTMKRMLVSFLESHRGVLAAENQIRAFMQKEPGAADYAFWLADLYMTHKSTDKALALLQEMIDNDRVFKSDTSEGLTARASLAEIQYQKGDRATAEKLVAMVLDADPNNRDALFVRARLLTDQGAYQEAALVLQTIIRDAPKMNGAAQLLAEIFVRQGYLDLAIETLSRYVDLDPANRVAHIRLAQLLALRQDTAQALVLVDQVIKLDPAFSVAWETSARIALQAQDWGRFDAALTHLADLPDQQRTVLFLKAQRAAQTGEIATAITLFKQIVSEDNAAPISSHALRELYGLSVKQGQVAALVSFLSSLPDKSPGVWVLLGQAFAYSEHREKAAEAYDKALAAGTTDLSAYLGRLRLFMQDGRFDDGLALLIKGQEATHGAIELLLAKAEILTKMDSYDRAEKVYDEILARNPNSTVAANNYAQLVADHLSNSAEALEKARVMAERFIRSDSPVYLDTLAWVYFRQGKLQQAQTIFERILAMTGPIPPAVHYHYGCLLVQTGHLDAARESLRKALAGETPFAEREAAAALLANINQ